MAPPWRLLHFRERSIAMAVKLLYRVGLALAFVFLVGFRAPVRAVDNVTTYVPAQTTVAVLPVINISGEKGQKAKAAEAQAAFDQIHKEFSDRGFRVLDDKAVADAMST